MLWCYVSANTQRFFGFGEEGKSLPCKSPMAVLFFRLPSCGLPRPCFGCLFSHPSPRAVWLGPQGFLTHAAASTGLHCFPLGLRMLPPQTSHQPCLSLPKVASLLTAFLQFLAQEKSPSQNVAGICQEQTDVVLKSQPCQACVAGCVQPKHLSSSLWTTCCLCMDVSASH